MTDDRKIIPKTSLPMIEGSIFTPFASSPSMSHASLEERLCQAVKAQSLFLEQMITRNRVLQKKLIELKEDVSCLQRQDSSLQSGTEPNTQDLLHILTPEVDHYSWALTLERAFPSPLCKAKYFHFAVKLVSLLGDFFPHDERFQLCVSIYTADVSPQPILCTMSGTPMLRGYPESLMTYGPEEGCHIAHFKIQICEVSSHFRNGWIFLVVQPKYADSDAFETAHGKVQPLIIEKVNIRAKDLRSKRRRAED